MKPNCTKLQYNVRVDTEREELLHKTFELSLLAKAAFAVVEIVGGVLVYFVSQQFLYDLAAIVTQSELTEDASDFVANYLLKIASDFSVSTIHFTSFYLASHGIIKLALIIALLKKRMWAYPLAILVFVLFIAYQLFRYMITMSPWLLVISVLDLFVIALTVHEYRTLKKVAPHP
jgi:uncharacterized membrane protein